MLSINQLCCFRNQIQLFNRVEIELQSGELLHLQGVNGVGKSTLLKTLAGLFKNYTGEIYWQEQQIPNLEFLLQLAYLDHKLALAPELSVFEQLRFNPKVQPELIAVALEQFNLTWARDWPSSKLSFGQKKRLSLAAIYASQAKLWLLDEPFSGLDVEHQQNLAQLLEQHAAAGGLAIFTSHQTAPFSREIGSIKLEAGNA